VSGEVLVWLSVMLRPA